MLDIAFKHSPKLSFSVFEETKKLTDLLNLVKDKDLENYLQKFPVAERFLYHNILEDVYLSKTQMQKYEAFLMLLDSFRKGE
jgi:hypothetical protein